MRTLIILFSPGTGGTHVRHMLSTASVFDSSSSVEAYMSSVKNTAHINEDQTYYNFLQSDHTISNVFHGHWAMLAFEYDLGNHTNYQNRQILTITPPTNNILAYNRWSSIWWDECQEVEQRYLYRPDIIKRWFGESDIHEYDADVLFTEDCTNFLEFTKQEMGLDLDWTACKKMHNAWYNRLTTAL